MFALMWTAKTCCMLYIVRTNNKGEKHHEDHSAFARSSGILKHQRFGDAAL
jgi:hypothetical protein